MPGISPVKAISGSQMEDRFRTFYFVIFAVHRAPDCSGQGPGEEHLPWGLGALSLLRTLGARPRLGANKAAEWLSQ